MNDKQHFSPLRWHPQAIKKFLLLWPRGFAKTTSTGQNYAGWLVGNWPDIHINIVSKTSTLAEQILTALTTQFEFDKKYHLVFGNVKPKPAKRWTGSQIIVKRKEISKNPTIKATGLMGSITGGRSDLIIADDIIDEENVRTRLQREKVITWFNKILIPTLYPWGAIIGIGTRWHYADLYSQLLKKWHPYVDVKQAINKQGEALWPEYWPLHKLEERRLEIGDVFFACQYQNDPTGMEGTTLKSEWLHPYEAPPSVDAHYYAGVDPALGEGDLQAIATICDDYRWRRKLLVDVWADALDFPLFLKKMRQQHATYNYSKIWVESNSFQKVLTFIPEFHQGLPIAPTDSDANKERRIIAMSSHFQAKRILINPFLKSPTHEFFNEWVQFPRAENDDALDAVEICARNIISTRKGRAWRLG